MCDPEVHGLESRDPFRSNNFVSELCLTDTPYQTTTLLLCIPGNRIGKLGLAFWLEILISGQQIRRRRNMPQNRITPCSLIILGLSNWLPVGDNYNSCPLLSVCFLVSVVNGLPFIGFGFLDNFIMILCVSFNYPSSRTRWSTNPHLLLSLPGRVDRANPKRVHVSLHDGCRWSRQHH